MRRTKPRHCRPAVEDACDGGVGPALSQIEASAPCSAESGRELRDAVAIKSGEEQDGGNGRFGGPGPSRTAQRLTRPA
jgi:hypothetical protein